jgi:hypothetical protein
MIIPLKSLLPSAHDLGQGAQGDAGGPDPRPAFVKRFRQEAQAARRLRHINTVNVDDFEQADDGLRRWCEPPALS